MFTTLLLTITTAAICLFLFLVGKRHRGAIPLLFRLFFFGNSITLEAETIDQYKIRVQKYGLLMAWVAIMIGMRGIVSYLERAVIFKLLWLLSINGLLLIGSLIQNYRDGIRLFQRGYRASFLLLIMLVWFQNNGQTARQAIRLLMPLHVAIYAFIRHAILPLLPTGKQHTQHIGEILMGLIHATVLIYLINAGGSIYYGLFYAQLYLAGLYTIMYIIKRQQPPADASITAQDILEGRMVLAHHQRHSQNQHRTARYSLVQNMSSYTKIALSICNSLLIMIMIAVFVQSLASNDGQRIQQTIYRIAILLFVYNFWVIKQINFYAQIQRIFVFFIINFGIYASLVNLINDSQTLLIIATMRNIGNSLAIFQSQDLIQKNILTQTDYRYWLIANLLATIVNVALLAQLPDIPGQLLFALATMYLGIQGFLMYYNIDYIKNLTKKPHLYPAFIHPNDITPEV